MIYFMSVCHFNYNTHILIQHYYFFQYASHTHLEQRIQKATLFNDSRIKEPYNGDLIRCYAVVAPKESIGVRVNTTLSFFAINQKVK